MNCSRSVTHTLYALYFSLVVQFSRIMCRRLRDSLIIIPQPPCLVNTFLKSFLLFFKVFSAVGCGLLPFYRTACTLYHVFSLLSIGFFMFFQFFSQFVIFVHRHTTLYMTFLSNPTKCTKKCTMQSGAFP